MTHPGYTIAQRRMIARSVGYRMGRNAAEKERHNKLVGISDNGWEPFFADVFVPDLVSVAEAGYERGLKFMRDKYAESDLQQQRWLERQGPGR